MCVWGGGGGRVFTSILDVWGWVIPCVRMPSLKHVTAYTFLNDIVQVVTCAASLGSCI